MSQGTTPADYQSRYPPPELTYSNIEKETPLIEREEENAKIIVNCINEVTDAVTAYFETSHWDRRNTTNDIPRQVSVSALKWTETKQIQRCFPPATLQRGCYTERYRLLKPATLWPDVLGAFKMETPTYPWIDYSADFRRPIAG